MERKRNTETNNQWHLNDVTKGFGKNDDVKCTPSNTSWDVSDGIKHGWKNHDQECRFEIPMRKGFTQIRLRTYHWKCSYKWSRVKASRSHDLRAANACYSKRRWIFLQILVFIQKTSFIVVAEQPNKAMCIGCLHIWLLLISNSWNRERRFIWPFWTLQNIHAK